MMLPDLVVVAQTATVIIVMVALSLHTLRQRLLPKPLPVIPYNKAAARSLLGDIPEIRKTSATNITSWILQQTRRHASPICQIFLQPFGKPCVLISDFREGQDILLRRKEFERSDYDISVLRGEAPNFHLNLKTGHVWKARRRLLRDLMGPSFLQTIAAPNIYESVSRLLELWRIKSEKSDTKPFVAEKDISYAALDAVFGFSFSNGITARALAPQYEMLQELSDNDWETLRIDSQERSDYVFPIAPVDPVLQAVLHSVDNITKIMATGFPALAWWVVSLLPSIRKMRAIRDNLIKTQVCEAVAKLETGNCAGGDKHIRSAVNLMLQRERAFAIEEGRDPIYWSEIVKDEIFGFVASGLETTSTTLCWGVKFIADNPECQSQLRRALHQAHIHAFNEQRLPTYQELIKTRIAYLDAVVEEILRLAHTSPIQDRECTEDTVILGHHIPKGTLVLIANKGPSFTEPAYDITENLRSVSSQMAFKDGRPRYYDRQCSQYNQMGKFSPERWLVTDEQTGEDVFEPTAWPTIPFGLGTRGCFGRKLAYMKLKVFITLLVWAFEFLTCPDDLSSYEDIQVLTRKALQCYVSLRPVIYGTVKENR